MTSYRLRLSLHGKKAWYFTRNKRCRMNRGRLIGRLRSGWRVGAGRLRRNRRRGRCIRHLRFGRRVGRDLRARRNRMHLGAGNARAVIFRSCLEGCMHQSFLLVCTSADFPDSGKTGNIHTGLRYPGRSGNIPAKNIFENFFRYTLVTNATPAPETPSALDPVHRLL